MSEIEKMKRYIERTKADPDDKFYITVGEAAVLTKQVLESTGFTIEPIVVAFKYGKAKGYRAAKAEGRAKA